MQHRSSSCIETIIFSEGYSLGLGSRIYREIKAEYIGYCVKASMASRVLVTNQSFLFKSPHTLAFCEFQNTKKF